MTASQFITAIPVFQGAQGKYYLVDGEKYHIRFPIDWAHNHIVFERQNCVIEGTGPKNCVNCKIHGSIRDVFVGYCGNCLRTYIETNEPRGRLIAPEMSVDMLENSDIWRQYPYMFDVKKSEIGDDESVNVTDEGINLERLDEAIRAAEKREQANSDTDSNEGKFVYDYSPECVFVYDDIDNYYR